MREMFVMARWKGRALGLPLSHIEAVDADTETVEAISDWHYSIDREYALR